MLKSLFKFTVESDYHTASDTNSCKNFSSSDSEEPMNK